MKNRIREVRKNDGGFTLVELLIVIVILGILAGVAVFGISNFQDTANQNACDENEASANTAAQAQAVYSGTSAPPYATLSSLVPSYLMAVPATTYGSHVLSYSTLSAPPASCS